MLDRIKNFIVSVGINMIFRYYYPLVLLVSVLLNVFLKMPWYITALIFAVWVIHAAIITVIITIAVRSHNIPNPQKGISLHPGRNKMFDEMYRKNQSAEMQFSESQLSENKISKNAADDEG